MFDTINPFLLLFLIIITFGFYLIEWFYRINLVFEKLDDDAPDRIRVFLTIFMLPFTWFFINLLSKYFQFRNLLIDVIEIVGWAFIGFLIIKYIYDFALTFGRITNTSGLFWFIILLIPVIGQIAFQFELNNFITKINLKKKTNLLYDV